MSVSETAAKPSRPLPPQELEVMKVLWSLGRGTVADVQHRLEPAQPLAYTTVMTMLDRLHKKGVVARRKQGRSYLYRPALSREAARQQALEKLVRDFFEDAPQELLRHLEGEPPASVPETTATEPLESALL